MKELIRLFLICACGLAGWLGARGQSSCETARQMLETLEGLHYQPRAINDEFSGQLFDALVEALDPQARYLTRESLSPVLPLRKHLDEALMAGDCAFLPQFTTLMHQQLTQLQGFLDTLSYATAMAATPADYPAALAPLPLPSRTQSEAALQEAWKGDLKVRLLLRQPTRAEAEPLSDPSPRNPAAGLRLFAQIKEDARCKITPLLDLPTLEERVSEGFLHALASLYDPHTHYLSPHEKAYLESALSRESQTFGLKLWQNAAGEIIIGSLMPGGAAWKANELNVGDVLESMAFPNGAKIDLICTSLQEVDQLLRSQEMEQLTLQVKKRNGQRKEVTLMREQLPMEDDVVSSFVLAGEHPIGYLSLPAFYTAWEDQGARGCTRDVITELLKLQAEYIEGLILDLRNNGGGAMKEALELAGIFLDVGPVSMMESQERELMTLKDSHRGTVYDGPLLILVNGSSASASEIFAAAMQDHRRAVIAGSPTYGKSTGQVIVPLGFPHLEMDQGFIKVTVHKFYRLNGQSHQGVGITPDVHLPEVLEPVQEKERFASFALAGGQVPRYPYFSPLPPLPVEVLAQNSQKRLQENETFRAIEAFNAQLPTWTRHVTQTSANTLPHASSIHEHIQRDEALTARLRTLGERPIAAFEVKNNSFNELIVNMDPHRKVINRRIRERLQRDAYLEEAWHIVADLIRLQP